jgi:hypothetical protein
VRTLSPNFTASIDAPETGEVYLKLLTISHPQLPQPFRLVDNWTSIVSRGNTYLAFPFEIPEPDTDPEQLPSTQLTIDGVDQTVGDLIESLSTPMMATVEYVIASDPDTVLASFPGLTVRDVEHEGTQMTGRLEWEDLLNEPSPSDLKTPKNLPGAFAVNE